mgnify:CR=1 FL=1
MYLYNSATHKKEEFKTHTPGHVEMYTCGPTVYHFAHIGNLRSYIMEDVLEKYLRYAGYDVNRVMNITDVGHLTSDADEGEDKMLKGAKREHKTVMEIAKYYTDAFFEDCRKLNIKRPDVVQPATGLIDDYIKIITKLIDTGYAYLAGGNVYFDTSKLKRYYIFNDHNEEDLAVGVREGVEEDTNKRNKNDFVLWFTKSKFEDQALKWDSPWGVGYPGWHIECSGISMKYNGEYLDLHCGGVDNAFPHHTNEIAQSESYLGHPWCPHWCHVAHLNTDHGKMSKSKGEFLTVSLLEEKGYDPLAYRFFCLQSHYRKSLVFTWENLDNATVAYNKLLSKIAALNDEGEVDRAAFDEYKAKFMAAMDNDLNTSMAVTVLYDVLKAKTNDKTKLALLDSFDTVLGLKLLEKAAALSEEGEKISSQEIAVDRDLGVNLVFISDSTFREDTSLLLGENAWASLDYDPQRSALPAGDTDALYTAGDFLVTELYTLRAARRLVILASEDIGLANPNALLLANACFDTVHKIGMPEARITLAETTIYLATSPKSNSAYMAINQALSFVEHDTTNRPVPLHLRNAPTKLMDQAGYGKGYKYAHDYGGFAGLEFMPETLKGKKFYEPNTRNAAEAKIAACIRELWKDKYK